MERYRWTRDMLLDDAIVVSIVEAGHDEERLIAALAAHSIETSAPWEYAYGVLRGAVDDLRKARDLDDGSTELERSAAGAVERAHRPMGGAA